ncbi:endo-1,3(4)-beta-glucanase [Coprinopsis cinerea okayama7|uniref:Endo-1,3(4)-beta-glucanase n=1 Tax=Coprinopsis cinerea (strain Okayama-7 / 130 / ATCC MYA-4618 / FGSC 9003) TaxID=240176 RepID=A8N2G5_COPC7|nr:endo-1,3(4)-beta-glucanase [Coprinopsis cinerea okayama7\|eukprot:XP_001828985.1 endo-1,3(4)-beta-glucanase [Coprinopsis cinerea okayama7\
MYSLQALPVYLLLVVAQGITFAEAIATPGPSPKPAAHLPRLVRRAHASAVQKTHSLARDLRVAFGSVLPRSLDEGSANKRVVYCKSSGKQRPFEDKGSQNNNPGDDNDDPTDSSSTPTGSQGSATRSSTSTRTRASTDTPSQPTPQIPDSPWRLTNSYEGRTFFEGWDFFTTADPTHGIVDYIDESAGREAGILEINDQGHAIMRVETTPTVPGNRKSIRITTQHTFDRGGLVIMDATHMPVGCGTWPAFWTNGPDWPNGGEIDILEGVHEYSHNQATLHTSTGCTITSTNSDVLSISGRVIHGTNCDVGATGNQGCGIRANSPRTYGRGFNEGGGGVYAMKWDSTGIAVYFFPRESIPEDITAEQPQPDTWGAAQARWPAATCDPFRFFRQQHAIFDTTLCGDWAGAVWNVGGVPGQEESCAERTGFSTCEAYVRANGAAFAEAYWEVRSVKIYAERN